MGQTTTKDANVPTNNLVTVGSRTITIRLAMIFSTGTHKWTPIDNYPVPGATVEVAGTTVTCKPSNRFGITTLKVEQSLLGKRVLKVSPQEAQNSGGPAGPSIGVAKNPEPILLRPFEVELGFNAEGIICDPLPTIKDATPEEPPYVKIYDCKPTVLTIDWRPDFIRALTRNARPPKQEISVVVLHHTGGPAIGSALSSFIDLKKGTPASKPGKYAAHYIVNPDGHVVKLAHESEATDHAGHAYWQGEVAVNSFSVGIEIVHEMHESKTQLPTSTTFAADGFSDAQYDSIIRLVRELCAACPKITRDRVVGHGEIAVASAKSCRLGRKGFEPDIHFDWPRLEEAKLCRAPKAAAAATPISPPLGSPPPAADETYYGLKQGQRITCGGKSKGAAILELKKDLFEIGYSISDSKITSSAAIQDDTYDDATSHAVLAFEYRYFSGSRALEMSWPNNGHLTWQTGKRIKEVLNDK
jgi:N-acetyl-anhydromuramyl-L-alanine amidase AmpD